MDDEQIDMELEEIWEMQRQRSKGGRGTSSVRKGRIGFLKGNKNRRGFSLTRKSSKGSAGVMDQGRPGSAGRGRPMSTGRGRTEFEENPRGGRSRSPWGRKKDRKVSINKFVEKIDIAPKRNGSRGRGRPIQRPIQRDNSTGRGRSKNMNLSEGIVKQRTRSWSLGRRKAKSDRNVGVIRVRSRSHERSRSQRFQPPKYDDAPPKNGFFGRFGRSNQDRRDDESWSSSDSEDDGGGGGGFFGGFR